MNVHCATSYKIAAPTEKNCVDESKNRMTSKKLRMEIQDPQYSTPIFIQLKACFVPFNG
jgi:hypothetical protein